MIKTFFDMCSGIGAGRLGLENCGLRCIGRSETSKLSDRTYMLMHKTDGEMNFGNLKKINANKLPDFDLLIAGFPCQSFSVIGNKTGFLDDRGQIIFHIARILSEKQPTCFILENVKGLLSHNNGETLKTILQCLKSAGYAITYKVLNSLYYGVPQMRQRIYIIGVNKQPMNFWDDFKWPQEESPVELGEFLVDKTLISPESLNKFSYYLQNKTNCNKYKINDIYKLNSNTVLDTRMNDLRIYTNKVPTLRAHRNGILYVIENTIYELSGCEALMLQGFPKQYVDKVRNYVSNHHLLMQAGNAMTVPVITKICNKILNYIKCKELHYE